jgi:hypothetical protein
MITACRPAKQEQSFHGANGVKIAAAATSCKVVSKVVKMQRPFGTAYDFTPIVIFSVVAGDDQRNKSWFSCCDTA